MKKRITPGQISQTNFGMIYQYIYQEEPVTHQDISFDLHLSRPTVSSKINEMDALGMIHKEGMLSSDQVGRKPMAFSIVPDYRVAFGVELLPGQLKMLMVNLRGEHFHEKVVDLAFERGDEYVREACREINLWMDGLNLEDEQVLGIGISVQGLVNAEGTRVTYGKILDCTGLAVDEFQRNLRFPCCFIHDVAAAAEVELWASPELSDFIYFNVGRHLGTAVIYDREILSGKHGYAAAVEHMQIDPRGKKCYCGKKGCAETVCSMRALLGKDDEEEFFEKLRAGDEACQERWSAYLKAFARCIADCQLLCDIPFVFGGNLASWLEESDLEQLYDEVERISPFPQTRDFLFIGKMPGHDVAIGAALPFIRSFLSDAFDGMRGDGLDAEREG